MNKFMDGIYFGNDNEISVYPLGTEERRKKLQCPCNQCANCMFAVHASIDYSDKWPMRCMLRE